MPIHPTAVVHANAQLAEDVDIGPYAIIDEHVSVGPGCRIWAYAYLTGHTTLGENNQVHMGAILGHWPQHLAYDPAQPAVLEVGSGNVFREQCVIHGSYLEGGKTQIGDGNYFMHHSHAGHDSRIGNRCIIAAGALISGHVTVGDEANLSGLTAFHQFIRIGRLAMVGGVSRVNRDIPPFMMVVGDGEVVGLNSVGMRRAGLSAETRRKIKTAYKIIYHQGLTRQNAVERLRALADCPEVACLAEFLATSKRGICPHRRGLVKLADED